MTHLSDLIAELRNGDPLMQEAADALMANQGAIVNSIIERTRHEPTGDEREALLDVMVMTKLSDYAATDMSTIHQAVDAILAAGFRRSEVPDPNEWPTRAEVAKYAEERFSEVIYLSEYNAAVSAFREAVEWLAGFRRAEVPEPSATARPCHLPQSAPPCIGCRCEPQGEPSDAQVEAAAREYHERGNGEGSFDRMADHVRISLLFRMRAALRAVGGAR